MLPLFKSHYSIGKSILTLEHPDKVKKDGAQSIFSISKDLEKIILVEDSLIGFLQAQKVAKDLNKTLIFGLRISCSHESRSEEDNNCIHKIIIFAKNDNGCKLLNSIYSHAFCEGDGVLDLSFLSKNWVDSDLKLCIPFYDSFIYMNNMHFCSCIPDFSFTTPTFLTEDNLLPFDSFINEKVIEYCEDFNFPHIESKSIFYFQRKDFECYQTYRCICSKKAGRQKTLSVPNFDHLASPEFCYESYLNHESS